MSGIRFRSVQAPPPDERLRISTTLSSGQCMLSAGRGRPDAPFRSHLLQMRLSWLPLDESCCSSMGVASYNLRFNPKDGSSRNHTQGLSMASGDLAVQDVVQRPERDRIVNDFSIQVATVNGSGSQSANTVLLRSLFRMGIPVSGKNLFPSNIAGLPTWYTIRCSKHGYIARKKEIDMLVAMNPETAKEDVMSLASGASVIYDEPLKLDSLRSDLIFYSVPYDKIVAAVCPEAKLRKLVKNMIYVGVVAQILGIDMKQVEAALRKQFAKKVKAADLNMNAAKAGFDYAAASLTKKDPLFVEDR